MTGGHGMPVGGGPNWHNAVAIALKVSTSLTWPQLIAQIEKRCRPQEEPARAITALESPVPGQTSLLELEETV